MNILIVEDEPNFALEIKDTILKRITDNNLSIKTTSRALSALEIAEEVLIDIFVIDIDLPDFDGLQLGKLIRKRKKYKHVPIIIESYKRDSDFKSFVHEAIDNIAYVTKPIDYTIFINKLVNAIEISDFIGTKHIKLEERSIKHVYNTDDIIYVEKLQYSKKLSIVWYHKGLGLMSDTFYITLVKFKELIGDDSQLIQIHRGYLINPKYILTIDTLNRFIFLGTANKEIPFGVTFEKVIKCL